MVEMHVQTGKILVIDSDLLSRRFLERVLAVGGRQVVSVQSVTEAKDEITRNGSGNVSCLMTELRAPQAYALDLVAWIAEKDPCVSTIVMSRASDQELFEQTLRSGACNLLSKPLDRHTTERAVEEAIQLTERKRRALAMQKDVEQVGLVQRLLIHSSIGRESSSVSLCLHPKHDAGGDFFSFYELPGSRSVAMLTDVSGHDLKSAFVAAYFQGMVRAMLEGGTSLREIFERTNRLLLNEATSEADGVPVSIAACSVSLNREEGKIEVLSCGAPSPVFTSATGECLRLQSGTSYPLGWFAETEVDSTVMSLASGQVTMWTDGVEELADNLKASAPAVAFALIRAQQLQSQVPWLRKANDDILVAKVDVQGMHSDEGRPAVFYTVLDERYRQEQLADIDALQDYWSNSLCVAMPNIEADLLHDVLLCTREGMINALEHGCVQGGEGLLQMTIAPEDGALIVIIEDPGPGHSFDPEAHAETAAQCLNTRHRGLILMKALTARFRSERRGAKITMEFRTKEI